MPVDVNVPGIGAVDRRWVYAGGAAVAGIVIYAWWRKRQTASSASSATIDPNAIDPLTGLTYGAELATGGSSSYVNPNPDASGAATVSGTAAITTNQQWTADVIDKLGSTYDSAFLSATLGKYLDKQPLTQDEANLIRTAWAFSGYPPNGPTTFTLATGSSGGGTTVPGPVTGLRATEWGADHASFAWAPTPGATSYVVSQPDGSQGRETSGTEVTVGGALGGNVRYPYTQRVAAKNSAGTGPAASITIASAGATH